MYTASEKRYEAIAYHRCGDSGLMLPPFSLGLWHNFGDITPYETMKELCCTAFDQGITHFDLANNYGPPCRRCRDKFREDIKNGAGQIQGRTGYCHESRI